MGFPIWLRLGGDRGRRTAAVWSAAGLGPAEDPTSLQCPAVGSLSCLGEEITSGFGLWGQERRKRFDLRAGG